jgi:hypothetical protein
MPGRVGLFGRDVTTNLHIAPANGPVRNLGHVGFGAHYKSGHSVMRCCEKPERGIPREDDGHDSHDLVLSLIEQEENGEQANRTNWRDAGAPAESCLCRSARMRPASRLDCLAVGRRLRQHLRDRPSGRPGARDPCIASTQTRPPRLSAYRAAQPGARRRRLRGVQYPHAIARSQRPR